MIRMTCDQARPALALLAGGDLAHSLEAPARQHLTACPDCREHWQHLQASQAVLNQAARQVPKVPGGSLRGVVEARLKTEAIQPRRDAAPSWTTVGLLTAACAAVVWLSVGTPIFDFSVTAEHMANSKASSFPDVIPLPQEAPARFVEHTQPWRVVGNPGTGLPVMPGTRPLPLSPIGLPATGYEFRSY